MNTRKSEAMRLIKSTPSCLAFALMYPLLLLSSIPMGRKRSGDVEIGTGWMVVIVVAVVFVGSALAGVNPFWKLSTTDTTAPPTTGTAGCNPPAGYTCTSLPLGLSLTNPMAGGAITSQDIKLYNGLATTETPQTGSGGTVTSALTYQSGQALTAYMTGNSLVTLYQPFVVPPNPTGNTGLTTIQVPLYNFLLGGWTGTAFWQVTGSGGTTFTDNTQYFWSQFPSTTSTTITVNINEPTNNRGYKTSYDILNALTQYLVVEASDAASATETIPNSQFFNKVGTTSYWQWIMPDGLTPNYANGPSVGVMPTANTGRLLPWLVTSQQLTINGATVTGSATLQVVGNTATGGNDNFNFILNKGSLGSGSSATISLKLFKYYSPYYFAINGNGGPNAAQIGSTFRLLIMG